MNVNVAMQTPISYNRNETGMIFKRISYAIITSYTIQFFSTGTLFTKVITIIDQHDRLLPYPILSANFSRNKRLKQQRISHQPN